MKRRENLLVNIRKMTACFLLALVLFVSLNMVVFAQEKEEMTVYPGKTVSGSLYFENIGTIPFYDVRAVASGTAEDWVSPTTLYFGTVGGNQKITRKYTLKVPEDAIVGKDYILTWEYYSEAGYEGYVQYTIHVTTWLPWLSIPLWLWILIISVLAIVILAIVIGVVVSRRRAREKVVTRICPQCGRTLPPTVRFCPYCGKTLGE